MWLRAQRPPRATAISQSLIPPLQEISIKTIITALAMAIAALAGPVLAVSERATCETQATDKKLSGAAKNSFVKKREKDATKQLYSRG